MALCRLCRSNVGGHVQDKTISEKLRQRLKNTLTMSALVGLTWVFGFFAIEGAQFIFSLIFCLCNSFQGVVLFILFCFLQEDVRETLRPYTSRLCCKSSKPPRPSQTDSNGLPTDNKTRPSVDMDLSTTRTALALFESKDNATDSITGDEMEIEGGSNTVKDKDLSHETKTTQIVTDFDTNSSPVVVSGDLEQTQPKAETIQLEDSMKIHSEDSVPISSTGEYI